MVQGGQGVGELLAVLGNLCGTVAVGNAQGLRVVELGHALREHALAASQVHQVATVAGAVLFQGVDPLLGNLEGQL